MHRMGMMQWLPWFRSRRSSSAPMSLCHLADTLPSKLRSLCLRMRQCRISLCTTLSVVISDRVWLEAVSPPEDRIFHQPESVCRIDTVIYTNLYGVFGVLVHLVGNDVFPNSLMSLLPSWGVEREYPISATGSACSWSAAFFPSSSEQAILTCPPFIAAHPINLLLLATSIIHILLEALPKGSTFVAHHCQHGHH